MALPAPAPARRTRILYRLPEWAVALAVAVGALGFAAIPRLFNPTFYYAGDTLESFVPLWHHLGSELRAGRWVSMDPSGWMGGNYAAEAAYGIWNPVNLANYALVSYFDDLSMASFVVMAEFLALFAVGVYLLCREYGARRSLAVGAAFVMPFSGFTLFYEAGGWPSGMMAVAWVTLFWWAALRQTRGRMNPIVTFVIGALTVSMGNPYAALGAIIVLAGLGIPMLLGRRFRDLISLAVTGLCAGSAALVVYLPLFLSADVTTRSGSSGISNDAFMQPGIGDLLGLSSPSYLPVVMTFGGPIEVLPSMYLSWLILPLLPWLRWAAIARRVRTFGLREMAPLLIIGGIYALLTFGPSNVGMFRWPIRLVEYLYVALLILFVCALALGLDTSRPRRRFALSGIAVLVGLYVSFSATPENTWRHLVGAVSVAALVYLTVLAWRRARFVGVGVAMALGTAVVIALQTTVLIAHPDPHTVAAPSHIPTLSATTDRYHGTVLQLAARDLTTNADISDGRFLFGNEIMATPVESSVNRYSGISFSTLNKALCMDYRGSVCREVYYALWAPVKTDIPIPLIDYLGVDTLVVQHALVPSARIDPPATGWHVAERDAERTVLLRDEPLQLPGRVTFASPGVQVLASDASAQSETVQYTGSGGDIVFTRLAWPGYTATVNGQPVDAVAGWHGLLKVSVPAGPGELRIEFRAPGQRLGIAAFALGTAVALVQGVAVAVRRRRRPA
ncbi:hypothetical protein [Rhodococcus sp. NPDC059234]|uniref:hypothetical protein n=1 Tax=Rhodococcus sp. NPDC059234 TaxID=3346781 RepID=UPI00366F7A93